MVPDWPCPRTAQRCMYSTLVLSQLLLTHRYSTTLRRVRIGEFSIGIQITPRSCSSSDGCITRKAPCSTARSRQLSIWKNPLALVSHAYLSASSLISKASRQYRRTELVPSWKMLYVPAKILKGLRSLPASRLSRWPQPHVLVLDWCPLLPNQPISGCP